MEDGLRERVERHLSGRITAAQAATGGYTPAARWIVELEDGRSAFVKAATNEATATWLQQERNAYTHIDANCMPRVLAWCDEAPFPLLILEDLSAAHWPPPWTDEHITAVFAMLDDLHTNATAVGIPTMSHVAVDLFSSWSKIAAAPEAFLSLGVVSGAWLQRALPTLIDAEASVSLDGNAVSHFDVRSDNMCLTTDGALLVDWNFACIGNGAIDTAFWMPSLSHETGRPISTLLPDAGAVTALVAGLFACAAGKPDIPSAPDVRTIQRRQLSTALPWMIETLGLQPMDGDPAMLDA